MLACQQIFGRRPLARSSSSSSSFLPYMHLPFSLPSSIHSENNLDPSSLLSFCPKSVRLTRSLGYRFVRPSELSPRKLLRAGLPLCDGNECGMHTERHVSSSNTYILSFLARIQPSLQTRLLLLFPRLSAAAPQCPAPSRPRPRPEIPKADPALGITETRGRTASPRAQSVSSASVFLLLPVGQFAWLNSRRKEPSIGHVSRAPFVAYRAKPTGGRSARSCRLRPSSVTSRR